jgi:hypothetical protein
MAKYLLSNSVQVRTPNGTTLLQPGKTIDDSLYNVATLLAAGAQLVLQADASATEQLVALKRKRYYGRSQLAGEDDFSEAFTAATDLNIPGAVAGDLLQFNGTNWVRLAAPGTYQQLTWTGTAWTGIGLVTAKLTDASITVDCALSGAGTLNASQFVLPPSTLTANRTLTLGTDSAVTGETITVLRQDVTAHTLAIVNGGAGAGTLITLPAATERVASFYFDGTNWGLTAVSSPS